MIVSRFRQIGEILRAMKDKQRIRNVGIVAHVDHGKTTLTDSLLVEAGLLSAEVAGSARVLDFLEEEQRRGITVKTANISLLYRAGEDAFVVNIVDTPGHVDFAGKVAGALRAIDGAVVVVDAVEEVMAQTETVTREALMERVKPVLFVNKVDRLFSELRLSPKDMQEKLIRIVRDFNSLIDAYGEPMFREKWKVDPALGSVVFGSALHRWGFSLARENPHTFDRAVLDAYRTGAVGKLPRLFPLSRAVLDMVVRHVPSPAECQSYRVPRMWKGDLESEVGKAMVGCDEAGPLVACVTNVQMVDGGLVATGRVFSGSVKAGDKVFLFGAERESKVKQVFVCMGAFREAVDAVGAGNIVGLGGVEGVRAGETLVDARFSRNIAGFESAGYVVEPVMTVALEPRSAVDLERLARVLERLVVEDPSLMTVVDTETGQYLLGGIGELHLEVALSFLRKYAADLNVSVSKPIVAYRETVVSNGRTALVKSVNKANSFQVRVDQLEDDVVDALDRSDAQSEVSRTLRVNAERVWAVDRFRNVLVVLTEGLNVVRDEVIRGFSWACRSGPLCMEPLRGVKVVVSDADVSEDAGLRDSAQITRAVSRGILGSCLSAGMVLLEPVYRVDLRVPVEWFGKCATSITKRRGKIKSTVQKAGVMEVSGFMPVVETFGLAAELRSASSGHAFWQFSLDHWEKIPEDLAGELVKNLRERRGLAPEVPKAETFVDELS
jgi:elongation factor 2